MPTLLRSEKLLFWGILLFLPTQLGKHFWPSFSYVLGIRIDYLAPTVYFTDLLLILLFIAFLLNNYKSLLINLKSKYRRNAFFLVLFFLSLFISTFLSTNRWEGFYGFVKFLELVFFTAYTACNYKKNKDVIPKLFAVAVVFETLLSSIQFVYQGSLGGVFYLLGERLITPSTPGAANASIGGNLLLRPYGTFSHPNVLAGYMVISFALFLFLWKRKLALFISPFVVITLLIALSRTAIVAFFLLITVFFIFKQKQRKYVLLTFSILLLLLLVSPLGLRFVDLSTTSQSITQRLLLTQVSLRMIQDNFIFGVGLQNFISVLPKYEHPALLLQPVHNIFLLWFCETGLIGFLFLCYFLWGVTKRILSTKKYFLFPVLFTLIFLGIFDHYLLTLQQGQLITAFVLGLLFV